MNTKEKIDFMISALQIAKQEIEYKEKYEKESAKYEPAGYDDWIYCRGHRAPNITLVRENLKTVSRYSSIVSKEIADIFDKLSIQEDVEKE